MRTPLDFEGAFNLQSRGRIDGLLVLLDALFFAHAPRIISLAAARRLPAIHSFRHHVEMGGLITYGVSESAELRRVGIYVDRS